MDSSFREATPPARPDGPGTRNRAKLPAACEANLGFLFAAGGAGMALYFKPPG